MTEFFGEIRALVQRGARHGASSPWDALALQDVLARAHREDASRYADQIIPYLSGFELPVLEVQTHPHLMRCDELLPARAGVRLRLKDEPDATVQLEAFLRGTLLERVTQLVLTVGVHLDARHASRLLRAPHLSRLTHLHLEGPELDAQVLHALAASPAIRRLTHLHIENSSYHHELATGLDALLGSPVLQALAHLEYMPYSLVGEGECSVSHIASARLRSLKHLKVRGYNDQLTWGSAHVLARSPLLAQLTSLDLSACELEPQVLAELLRPGSLGELEALNLGQNHLGEEGAKVLAEAACLGRLRVLNLWQNQLQSSGFEQVLGSTLMGSLQALNVRGNWIDAHGMRAARHVSAGVPLRALWLGHNALGDEGARELFGSAVCEGLEVLGLQSNGVEARGFLPLEHLRGRLEVLQLDFNEPGELGIGALARSSALRRLQRLGLMWCMIHDEGLDALSRAACVRGLRHLDLSHNGVSTQAMVRFVSLASLERLERLELRGNRLDDALMQALAERGLLERLKVLDVQQNRLGEGALKTLQGVRRRSAMVRLAAAGNTCGEGMEEEVVRSPHFPLCLRCGEM